MIKDKNIIYIMAKLERFEHNPEWLGANVASDDYRKWLLNDKAREEEKLFRSDRPLIGDSEFAKKLVSVDGRLYPRTRGRPRK